VNEDYSEKLWPAWWVWGTAGVIGGGLGLTVLRFSGLGAVVTTVVITGLICWLLARNTPEVAVRAGVLHAGRAQVPVGLTGQVEELDATTMRHGLGPGLDARAFLCIRGWIHTGVRVQLDDPKDPTPYWLLSSRRPELLAQAIRRAPARSDRP
jgi:hypothetical protein